jgi:Raf kinase inhibitor-like YbhB/YbcL family protein
MKDIAIRTLDVISSAFSHNKKIPVKYTCDGENINPPLSIPNIPKDCVSMVIIVDDPDAPVGVWDHWIVWDIKPKKEIRENSIPGTEGINSFQKHHYSGPCPPSKMHHYYFKVYALDKELNLPPYTKKKELEKAMEDHILAAGGIIGTYQRKK